MTFHVNMLRKLHISKVPEASYFVEETKDTWHFRRRDPCMEWGFKSSTVSWDTTKDKTEGAAHWYVQRICWCVTCYKMYWEGQSWVLMILRQGHPWLFVFHLIGYHMPTEMLYSYTSSLLMHEKNFLAW